MFRFADVGRQWVPVELPQGEERVQVHFLFDLITREELKARDRKHLELTGPGLISRASEVKSVADLLQIFDENAGVAEADRAELLARTHDWKGFVAADGSELGCTRERLEALLGYEFIFHALRRALYQAS